jgi:hypothetical protein
LLAVWDLRPEGPTQGGAVMTGNLRCGDPDLKAGAPLRAVMWQSQKGPTLGGIRPGG